MCKPLNINDIPNYKILAILRTKNNLVISIDTLAKLLPISRQCEK